MIAHARQFIAERPRWSPRSAASEAQKLLRERFHLIVPPWLGDASDASKLDATASALLPAAQTRPRTRRNLAAGACPRGRPARTIDVGALFL